MRLAARVIVICFLVFLSIAAAADSLTGKVVKVADGDSITVLDSTNMQHRIRFVLAVVAIGFRLRNLSLSVWQISHFRRGKYHTSGTNKVEHHRKIAMLEVSANLNEGCHHA